MAEFAESQRHERQRMERVAQRVELAKEDILHCLEERAAIQHYVKLETTEAEAESIALSSSSVAESTMI
jgi:hypothetical protein